MDPVTAFATAGTVATFVQMGYHLIVNTYTIYNAASGMAKEDEQLGFFIEKLGNISESMISSTSNPDLSDNEQGIMSVASKCINLSNRLVEILGRSRTKDPHSLRQSAIAAFHSLLNNSKKDELKKELDECQKLFHMQLSQMISSNTIQSLKKLDGLGESDKHVRNEVASLRRHILELEKGVILKDIGEEAANKLAGLLQLSSDSLSLISAYTISEALSFSKLHQRYETVGKALSETFNWIFEDDPARSPKALQGKILFTNWLGSGKGIFHVAGKPGSGKSTLMKFIYKHEKTKALLESWAAGRDVIMGKHFFWKPGEDTLENSINGLLRTLLYDVLEGCPGLASHIFPEQSVRIKGMPHLSRKNIRLEPDDIHDAFNRLIDNRHLFENRCFFFMIDGLDEFRETCNEGYKQLVRLISSWTMRAPEQVKICVSSREHAVFLDHFSEIQGLRLQDLTADDIHRYVKERLESNPNFLEMEKPKDGASKLIAEVTEKADGVFLWVALVVKLLDDACDEGDDFEYLEQKVNFLPPEIRDLFDELFGSIHESDLDESAQTFAIALKLLKNKRGMRLSLLRYSLLNDYNIDPLFASNIDSPDQKMLIDWGDQALEKRLKKARKQLYKRCKGLLEVVESEDDPLSYDNTDSDEFKETPLAQRISLIHRSIQEYLEEKHVSQERATRTKDFDVVNAICQTYVAELTALKQKEPDRDINFYYPELVDITNMLSEAGVEAVSQGWIATLQILDRSRPRYLQKDDAALDLVSGYDVPIMSINETFSVAHSAATYGLYTFFAAWDAPCTPIMEKDIKNGSLALAAVYGILFQQATPKYDSYISIFRWLFNHGCSPNQAVLKNNGGSPWWALLTGLYHHGKFDKSVSEAVEVFLEWGANPDFTFVVADVDGDETKREKRIKILPPAAQGTSTVESSYSFIQEPGEYSELFRLVSSKGGRAILRDFIEAVKPPNWQTLLALIDRNMNNQQPDQQAPDNSSKEAGPSVSFIEDGTDIETLVEEPVKVDYEADPKLPDNMNTEIAIPKDARTEMTIDIKGLMSSPIVTFILGMFVSYCFFVMYGPKGN